MKKYQSLEAARKSLIMQVAVLLALTVIISFSGRLYDRNLLNTSLILSYEDDSFAPDDVFIKWENEEMAVLDYAVRPAEEGGIRASVINLKMKPGKPGKYGFTVTDKGGNRLASDIIYVDRTSSALSKQTGHFTGDEGFILAVILFYGGLGIIMLVFFIRLSGPLMYSYEAILSFGVLVFSAISLLFELPVYFRHLSEPAFYPPWQLLNDIAAGGKYFVLFTCPVILVFSVLLIISNIALLRHESHRFRNYLGLLLGISLIAGELLYGFWYMSGYLKPVENFRVLITVENLLGIMFTYVECILISSVVNGLRAAKHKPSQDRDYILILGCGFNKDGTLPPLIRGRVDRAMEFWYSQREKTGREAILIPSGGQGRNEPMPEAEAMYRYLMSKGIPEHAVIRESQSLNTYQNMEFSRNIIKARVSDLSAVKTVFVTTNYHVFRSGVWAGLAGLRAEGLGSRTRWWFWPNAFVRECVGLLRNKIVPEILFLVMLILVFGLFTFLSFL